MLRAGAVTPFCAACGWLIQSERVCPAYRAPLGAAATLADKVHPALGQPRVEDYPELQTAFLAWSQKDWARMVGQCLLALEIESPTIYKRANGPVWAFVHNSAVVYLSIDQPRELFAVEAPMVRLPETRRVALMRTLLELNHGASGVGRFILRGSTVLLRFCDRIRAVAPPKLVQAVSNVAICADQYDDLLALSFDAEMIGPLAQKRNLDLSFLGEPTPLALPEPARSAPARAASSGVQRAVPKDVPIAVGVPDGRGAPRPVVVALQDASDEALPVLALPSLPAPPPIAELPEAPRIDAALLELLATTIRYSGLLDSSPGQRVLLERAAIFLAHDRHRATSPDAVRLMVARLGQLLEAHAPSRGLLKSLSRPTIGTLRFLFQEIHEAQARVQGPNEAAVPQFPSLPEAKETLRFLLAEAQQITLGDQLSTLVHEGILCEALHRLRMPPKVHAQITSELERGRQQARGGGEIFRVMIQRIAQ
jgi:hypothetical protein